MSASGDTHTSALSLKLNGVARPGQLWTVAVDGTTYHHASATVTLSGEPSVGETWTIALNDDAALSSSSGLAGFSVGPFFVGVLRGWGL